MNNNVQEKIHALFVEYTKQLPAKINLLDTQWHHLLQYFDKEKFQEFHRAVHSMCGSSGTYGYKQLSQVSRELEVYLKPLLKHESLAAAEQQKISQFLLKMKAVSLTAEEEKLLLPSKIKESSLSKRVYILDDDSEFINELKTNLDSIGYYPTLFAAFSEFAQEMDKMIPAAVVVDAKYLIPPAMDYLHEYRKTDEAGPLFVVSKNSSLLTRLSGIRSGGTAFFPKPIEIFYLTKAIDQACGSLTNEPLRILVVDDSKSLADYYGLILQEAGMDVRTLTRPLEVLDILADFRPDLLLLDVYMPACSGLELAAVLRQEAGYASIPIIFLSTEDDRFKQLAALSLGGDDFLTKPILPQHLIATVRTRAERAGLLSSYMIRDSLTGLLNHTNILQHLEVELTRAARTKTSVCFMMIDIDHFKSINDRYGHPMGDRVIRKLSEILVTRLRKTDFIGRYGGEEFATILPQTDSQEALRLCTDIREAFAKIIFQHEATHFHVTFSVGIAVYPAIQKASDLIETADQALYKAKHQGRNREVLG